jgi:ubiquinone/menaquinone biosynthesis C-methylase UbiE
LLPDFIAIHANPLQRRAPAHHLRDNTQVAVRAFAFRPARQDKTAVAKRGQHRSTSTTDWSDVAGWYDQLVGEAGSEYHREVVLPGVLRLLSLNAGERFVDIACGQGVLCRMARQKHVETTGVDAAEPLISAARQRGPADIRYHIGDARELRFLPASKFHAAACVLAIQNIHPIQPVFQGVADLLVNGGRFVVAMMHPCFRGPKESSWGWDEANKVQYRRIDRYLLPRKTPIATHPGKSAGLHTWTFHKPIQAYVKALRNAGLLIDAIEEWPSHKHSDSGPRAGAENAARKEIPMFMAVRAVRVAGLNDALNRLPDGLPPDADGS